MTNKPRIKGTHWESELLPRLQLVYPNAERAPLKGINDRGDFTGVPIPIEAKSTGVPHFMEWARKLSKHSPDWLIAWHGDRRTERYELAVMPLNFAMELLMAQRIVQNVIREG